jgi:hypothetical protein
MGFLSLYQGDPAALHENVDLRLTTRSKCYRSLMSGVFFLLLCAAIVLSGQTRANILRGEYGRYRANNDLLSYHLDIRVDPEKKVVSGKNTIRFKMLQDDTRIQLDLYADLAVDRILLGAAPLKYERDLNTVWVDFSGRLKAGRTYSIDFYYSGTPSGTGRFGAFAFGKDPAGRHWITTACEGPGASIWWPNKDQWRDEVENTLEEFDFAQAPQISAARIRELAEGGYVERSEPIVLIGEPDPETFCTSLLHD